MLLSAAIVGVVVPLLAKEPTLVQSAAAIKMAAVCWLACLLVAALGQASDRHTLALITNRFNADAAARYDVMLAGLSAMLRQAPPPAINSEPVNKIGITLSRLETATKIRARLQDVEDFFVYGSFVAGVVVLIWNLP
jgi:hypothetical protein